MSHVRSNTIQVVRRTLFVKNNTVSDIANVLATQLHPEQEAEKQQIVEDITEDDDELSKMVERIDERNELIINLVRVSRKPGSGLLDPKVTFFKNEGCRDLGTHSKTKSSKIR